MCPTRLALLVALGLMFVRLAFALTVPFGSAPDEGDHFSKAVAAAHLDFGTRSRLPAFTPTNDMERLNASLRVRIDLGDHPLNPTWGCNAFRSEVPAGCLDPDARVRPGSNAITNFGGTFPPFLYVVVGAPSWVMTTPDTTLLAMRLVVVALTTLLSTWALVIAARRWGTNGLLAPVLGATPMVLYTQGTLGTSGIEAAAAFAMAVSAIDVLGDGPDAPTSRSPWPSRVLLVASTAILCASRPMSALIAATVIVVAVVTVGPRASVRRIATLPRAYAAAAAVIGLGSVAASVGWSLASPPVFRGRPRGIGYLVHHFLNHSVPGLWQGVIGNFEWLDTQVPAYVVIIGWLAIVGAITWSAPRRDRAGSFRVWFLVAATLGLAFVVDASVFARVGGDVQARHILPLLQLWPLAAVIPGTSRAATSAAHDDERWNPLRVGVLCLAATTFAGWWYTARREAVGVDGPMNFLGSSKWHPAVGWAVPVLLVAVGLALAAALPAWSRAPRAQLEE